MLDIKRTFSAVAAGFGLLSLTAGASAATINELIDAPPVRSVFGSDENREEVIAPDGSVRPVGATILAGDVIHGIVAFEQLFVDPPGGQVNLDNAHGNSELTGEFSLLVAAKVPDLANPGKFALIFAPNPAFDTGGVGTLIRLYEDPVVGFSSHFNVDGGGSKAVGIGTVTDGSFYNGLGLASAGNFYLGYGTDVIASGSPTLRIGDVFFALDRTEAGLGSVHKLDPLVQVADLGGLGLVGGVGEVIGTGEIGPRVFGSPWELGSNSQFQLKVIPIPAAVWGGMALLGGLGVARRVRR
jgi:hypothetical protein